MMQKSSKQSIIKLKLFIKTLEDMDVKSPLQVTDISYDATKRSLVLFYSNGSKRGYLGAIAERVYETFKNL